MYKIEAGRYGKDWQEEEVEFSPHQDLNDLSTWIEKAKRFDSYDGKYEYRVVDETDKEFYHCKEPYEGVRIDIQSDPTIWLDRIRYDYRISVDTWKQACEMWLEWEKNREQKCP